MLKNENQYKIEIEYLKEEIFNLKKLLRKPLTNIELEKRVVRDDEYKKIARQLSEMASVLEYIEKLDKAQDEKSLIVRAIKSIVQEELKVNGNINFT